MPDVSIVRPNSLAHVVFRTGDIRGMVDFWESFLGAERVFESEFIAFLRYDEEHHRVAIIKEDNLAPRTQVSAGLHHVAFSYDSLQGLLEAYKERLSNNIKPTWCVNHGPTTSIYYKDPDGNAIETQVDNFSSIEEANAFMTGSAFQENPIGTDVDPDDLLLRLGQGASEDTLKKRVEIGARVDIPAGV